jgi:hypothetical protein
LLNLGYSFKFSQDEQYDDGEEAEVRGTQV